MYPFRPGDDGAYRFACPIGKAKPKKPIDASGVWKKVRNPYTQVIGEKLALRDEMRRFSGADVAYPGAAVVFVPAIPSGSTIPQNDFKVSFCDVNGLPGLEVVDDPVLVLVDLNDATNDCVLDVR